jgi:glutathione S-transferase
MDGIMDAALLVVYEARFRPEGMQVESVLKAQRDRIIRGLASIGDGAYTNGAMPDLGEIGLACLLDYLDFRKQVDWRDHAPQLVSWMQDFGAAVPGYENTMPAD